MIYSVDIWDLLLLSICYLFFSPSWLFFCVGLLIILLTSVTDYCFNCYLYVTIYDSLLLGFAIYYINGCSIIIIYSVTIFCDVFFYFVENIYHTLLFIFYFVIFILLTSVTDYCFGLIIYFVNFCDR